jgi:hypothetical protein
VTRKELLEKGYIDQYVLGLTTDEENTEVERLANLYPEIQEQINSARHRICSNFNRNLTRPALSSSLLTKRRVLLWSGLVVSFFSIGFCFLCREHFSLQENYTMQQEQLNREKAKVIQLASFTRMASEQSNFLNDADTKRIKLKGSEDFPEAEAMVFYCEKTGKMMLRVIDLPGMPRGRHYEVLARTDDSNAIKVGELTVPVRFDSVYSLDAVPYWEALEITSVDPYMMDSVSVCSAAVNK